MTSSAENTEERSLWESKSGHNKKNILCTHLYTFYGFPGGLAIGICLQCKRHRRCGFDSWRRRVWQPTPIFLPGESHRKRRLRMHVHRFFIFWICQYFLSWHCIIFLWWVLPSSSAGKESTCNAGDPGLIPGLGRSPGEGNSYTLQYSGLENSMEIGVWQATVTKSWTQLSDFHFL